MNLQRYKVLVVDDEEDIVEFLEYNLKREGFIVKTAFDGKEAIETAKEFLPHIILLDVMMPEVDGIETCERIREIPGLRNTLIAFLTARAEDYSQIAGFNAGGDDYMTKPIKPKVLVSRLKALLKRYEMNASPLSDSNKPVMDMGSIIIDKERFIVMNNGVEITLPKKEFQILALLASKPSKVFTRDEIFDKIWGNDVYVGDRTLDVYIRKIREKVGMDTIKTIKGVGYKFE
ncbi:MAG: response regulator transcription factor [Bacteroidales bacterium]|nr:response regulator transcription factor [Bacteroidales bacterium]